jgi:hypothetical protein
MMIDLLAEVLNQQVLVTMQHCCMFRIMLCLLLLELHVACCFRALQEVLLLPHEGGAKGHHMRAISNHGTIPESLLVGIAPEVQQARQHLMQRQMWRTQQ